MPRTYPKYIEPSVDDDRLDDCRVKDRLDGFETFLYIPVPLRSSFKARRPAHTARVAMPVATVEPRRSAPRSARLATAPAAPDHPRKYSPSVCIGELDYKAAQHESRRRLAINVATVILAMVLVAELFGLWKLLTR